MRKPARQRGFLFAFVPAISPIGSIAKIQEMLDSCGQNNIAADVEVMPIQKINEAYECMARGDVKYRFSIDMASLKSV